MPLILELHLHSVFRSTDPSKARVNGPFHSKLLHKTFPESFIELAKDGMDAIVGSTRLGRETGGVNLQGVTLAFEPSQMPHAVIQQVWPMPITIIIGPGGLGSNAALAHKFVSKPCHMDVQPDVLPVLGNGFLGNRDGPFHELGQAFPPHHLVNELCHVGRLSLLEVGRHVILLQRLPTTSDQCSARIRHHDPHRSGIRSCLRRCDAFDVKLLREEGEFVHFANWILFAIKPDG